MVTTAITAKEQFDRQAKHYDGQWNSWSEPMLGWLLRASSITGSASVLDVATGGGFTALAFAQIAADVVACDISTGMLAEASARAAQQGVNNIRFVESSAESMPFDGSSFSTVVCRLASHHFVNVIGFVEESFRVLRPGGALLIADTTVPDDDPLAGIWQNDIERLRDGSHWRNYSPSEWRSILEFCGFKVVELEGEGDGIKIPLSSWMEKSGCNEMQSAELRRRFILAPDTIQTKYRIETDESGDIVFTWKRVLVKAVKPA